MPPDDVFIDEKCSAVKLHAVTPLKRDILVDVYKKVHPEIPITGPVSEVYKVDKECLGCEHNLEFVTEHYCIRTEK